MSGNESLEARSHPWCMTLATVGGIPLRIHASFAILLLWVAVEGSATGNALAEVLFVLGIFACVLLHELGHALAGKRFGVPTKDITLYPFGGIATLAENPRPWAELWIALAGPAVNVVIAALIFPTIQWHEWFEFPRQDALLLRLFAANVFLAVFNMIPAFPMDGGRVLRALLALMRVRQATVISSRLSQFLSVLLGIFALYTQNPILIVVAVFVFMNAMQELIQSRALLGAEGKLVSEVMIARANVQVLRHGMTLTEALDIALRSTQPAFPVVFGEQVMGVVARETILHEAAVSEGEHYVSGFMDRDFLRASATDPVASLVQRLQGHGCPAALIFDGDSFIGVVYREKLFEFLYLHGIRRARAEQQVESGNDPSGL